ncbi:MAG: NUDIX hydrolase [Gammaproteobacteria bacterium]
MVWKPHVTVAAVIEKDRRFLLVEEETTEGLAFNQPAGHLENGEDLISAIKREVIEETAWKFEPQSVIAVQLWRKDILSETFLRICFSGYCHSYDPEGELDDGIVETHWLSRGEIAARRKRLRSPLVLTSIDEYLCGRKFPLSILKTLLS